MEKMDFETTPYGEQCAQVGSANYRTQAEAEATAMINMVERLYPKPAEGDCSVTLYIKANPHDFGVYYSIEGRARDEAGIEWLYAVEEGWPEFWDNDALLELQAKGYAPRTPDAPALPGVPIEAPATPAKFYSNPPAQCDVCHGPIGDDLYDQKTKRGPWANMCADCSAAWGVGVGQGLGQHYHRQPDGRFLKVEG